MDLEVGSGWWWSMLEYEKAVLAGCSEYKLCKQVNGSEDNGLRWNSLGVCIGVGVGVGVG